MQCSFTGLVLLILFFVLVFLSTIFIFNGLADFHEISITPILHFSSVARARKMQNRKK